MKILCKVYPSENTCCGCVDEQLRGEKPNMNCEECRKRIPDYEVLQFGHSLFVGDWAIVLDSEGRVTRVKMDRVRHVRTVSEGYMPDVVRTLDKLVFSLERQVNKFKF